MLLQIALVVVVFLASIIMSFSDAVSILYGGCIGIVNNLLIRLAVLKSEQTNQAAKILTIMFRNAAIRMFAVAVLIMIAIALNLEMFALIIGLVVGQIGLIFEKIKKL